MLTNFYNQTLKVGFQLKDDFSKIKIFPRFLCFATAYIRFGERKINY